MHTSDLQGNKNILTHGPLFIERRTGSFRLTKVNET